MHAPEYIKPWPFLLLSRVDAEWVTEVVIAQRLYSLDVLMEEGGTHKTSSLL